MYNNYTPLMKKILNKFHNQKHSINHIFKHNLKKQTHQINKIQHQSLLSQTTHTKTTLKKKMTPKHLETRQQMLNFPLNLHIKDENMHLHEKAMHRLLKQDVLRTTSLIETLLTTPIHTFLNKTNARKILSNHNNTPKIKNLPPN